MGDFGRSLRDGLAGADGHPSPDGLGPSDGIPNAVYVIIGSSGEYSDRHERVIGFVLTKEAAEAAVAQAEQERGLPDPIPYPEYESTYGFQREDGSWFDGYILDRPPDGVWRQKPNAEEITARQEAAVAAWRQARADAGRIDPDGSMDGYYFEKAPLLASASAGSEAGAVGDESAAPKADALTTPPNQDRSSNNE